MYSLVLFNGSARKGQFTQHVTSLVEEVLDGWDEFESTVVDPRELDLRLNHEGQRAAPDGLKELMQQADAYLIVAPEYNHGYPGSLKYVLDLNLKAYIHKPVAMVGVSKGRLGGARMIEALVPVVRELGMVATFTDVNVSHVREVFENGEVRDKETWVRRIERMLTELLFMTKTLSWGREHVPSEYYQKTGDNNGG